MTEKDRLLAVRERMNRKRPTFLRSEWHRLKRLRTSWRSPKGIDSKMRESRKGKRKSPGTGYRNPRAVRYLHPSGREIVQVANVADLELVNNESQVAQIRKTVGSRKRLAIIEQAGLMDIHIINPQIRHVEATLDEDIDEEVLVEDDYDDLALIDDDDLVLDEDEDLADEEATDDAVDDEEEDDEA